MKAAPPATADGSTLLRLDYPKREIWLIATSQIEHDHRALSCTREPWTIDWLERFVRPGDIVYDVGANVGAFSLVAAIGCQAQVYAFEPSYATYARLCDNIHLNGCDDTIVALPWALSDRRGLTAMRHRSLEAGQSRHRLEEGAWHPRKDPSKPQLRYRQPICALRMDDVIRFLDLPAPVHMKIDVDGAEERVIKGGLVTLGLASLRSVLIEVDAPLWGEVVVWLGSRGLTLQLRYDRSNPGAPIYGLFVRS